METQDTDQTPIRTAYDAQGGYLPLTPGLALPGVQSGGPLPELFAAKAKARAKFEPIERTREVEVRTRDGRSYTFMYAPLDVVLAATMPALAENGLDLFWLLAESPDGGCNLTCMLTHASGAYIATTMRLPPTDGPQARGSQITYGRRYQAQAVLGVASEEDDDGNAAAGNDAKVAPRQRSQAGSPPAERPAPRREPPSPPKKAAAGNGAAPPADEAKAERLAKARELEQQIKDAGYGKPEPEAKPEEKPIPFGEPAPSLEDAPPDEPTVEADDLTEMTDADLFAQVRTLANSLGIDSSNKTKAADICQEITGKRRMADLDRAGVETLVRGLRKRVAALAAESSVQ